MTCRPDGAMRAGVARLLSTAFEYFSASALRGADTRLAASVDHTGDR
jgi:hypothetical protein